MRHAEPEAVWGREQAARERRLAALAIDVVLTGRRRR